MSVFKDEITIEKCRHIIKLLDEEDRHVLFELLFRFLKQDKKRTASIMGVTQSNIDHALDDEVFHNIKARSRKGTKRKKPYTPKPEQAAKMLFYLANEVAANMDNAANERELYSAFYKKEALIALKDYKSKAANYDADFAAAWAKIIGKLRSEERILYGLWDMNWHDYLSPELTKRVSLQANISVIEQVNVRIDKLKKLCSEKAISPPSNLAVLEVIAKFPDEEKWLLLVDKAVRLRLNPEQMQKMCDFIEHSNNGRSRTVWVPPG